MSTLAYVGSAIAGTVAISLATAYALGAFDYKYENFLKYATGNGFVYIGDKEDSDSNSVKSLIGTGNDLSDYSKRLKRNWNNLLRDFEKPSELEENLFSGSSSVLVSKLDNIVEFVKAWCQAFANKPTQNKKNWTEKEIKADKDWAAFEAVCLIKK
ncbi:hypothetical protein [Candidatus Mycoplasma haematohominis]|uniref:hypothetical protein n=1 Tax=Candidatus Mycoplasma haematohominis TaxID=1494318 RepID=UPI001C0A6D78|nr:hypothetical protein [Candidatus Mycoplasma haemohominis]